MFHPNQYQCVGSCPNPSCKQEIRVDVPDSRPRVLVNYNIFSEVKTFLSDKAVDKLNELATLKENGMLQPYCYSKNNLKRELEADFRKAGNTRLKGKFKTLYLAEAGCYIVLKMIIGFYKYNGSYTEVIKKSDGAQRVVCKHCNSWYTLAVEETSL